MTTNELALIDPPQTEVAEVQPLTARDAKVLDKKIRATGDRAVKSHEKTLELFDELTTLLTEARDREIHKALGLKSWTAYIADAVNLEVPQRDDRKALTLFLSGQGMSQRAIANALGVSQKTIDRDLDGAPVENGATVESLDGKKRPKIAAAEEEQPIIDAEVVDPPQDSDTTPEAEPMSAVEIVDAFNDETVNLWAAHSELKLFLTEQKWGGARKRVAKANLNHLQEVTTALQAIIDDLMTQ